MKLTTFFLLMLFTFNSFAKPAWEIPYDQQKWSWVKIGMSSKKILVGAELTKIEAVGANKFIIPIASADDIKKIFWLRLDCGINKAEDLGQYVNNRFSNDLNPQINGPGSISYSLLLMICGVNSDRSAKIYGVYGVEHNEGFTYHGIVLDEIKLNTLNPDAVDINIYAYYPSNGKTGESRKTIIDCKKQTAIEIDESFNGPNLDTQAKDINADDVLIYAYKYMSKLACNYAEKNLWVKNNKKENINQNTEKKSLITIDEAKDKCKTLGFKTGTEKFGTCVLELTR